MIPPGYLDFGRACTRARGAATRVLTVFFITWSIFGFFQPFLSLNVLEHSSEKNAYKHNIVGLTAWPGSPEEGGSHACLT